jgi:hypothetical protein
MPASAYGLLGVFTLISLVAGIGAARLLGPWRPWAPILPSLSAFAALWFVGHRLGLAAGPEIALFGYRVSIVLDVAVAATAAAVGAAAQMGILRLLDAHERRARRNRLA